MCLVRGAVETTEHLFFDCAVIKPVWQLVAACILRASGHLVPLNKEACLHLNFPPHLKSRHCEQAARLFSEAIYATWIKRNDAVFGKKSATSHDIVAMFLYRLRVRLKADFQRLEETTFRAQWGGLAAISNGQLVLNLPPKNT